MASKTVTCYLDIQGDTVDMTGYRVKGCQLIYIISHLQEESLGAPLIALTCEKSKAFLAVDQPLIFSAMCIVERNRAWNPTLTPAQHKSKWGLGHPLSTA